MTINLAAIKAKIEKYARVLKITKKPDREEFAMTLKVTGAGILVIGAIGFAIYLTVFYLKVFG